jgi:MFS family permease
MLSRNFLILLVAQFQAAFSDQVIHAAAVFFIINQNILDAGVAISLMPIFFYAPWAIFCTLAGYMADRYSKTWLTVLWKGLEVGIALVALLGFWLGASHGSPVGPWLVLGCVFLMGAQSAFFGPVKYGIMPEILSADELSRGNGWLESLSFLAVILGTVVGGVLSFVYRGNETVIGVILLVLSVLGFAVTLGLRHLPAAHPQLRFPRAIYGPLWRNLRLVLTSRPLRLAVVGIAFFTFILAFMRATVYMLGESQNPRWDELKTSIIVGTVALGIGLGSPLAGYLSGRKVELGLIPLGALGIVLATIAAAVEIDHLPLLVGCIVLIGFSTGFYLVPLFTLLQRRAPKAAKGNVIATSNFVNVVGAITASLVFFGLVLLAKSTGVVKPVPDVQDAYARGELADVRYERGQPVYAVIAAQRPDDIPAELGSLPTGGEAFALGAYLRALLNGQAAKQEWVIDLEPGVGQRPTAESAGKRVVVARYRVDELVHYAIRPEGTPLQTPYDLAGLPRYLFLGAGLLTLLALLGLLVQMPDLLARGWHLLASLPRRRVEVVGLNRVPADGPVILVARDLATPYRVAIRSVTDRYTHFYPELTEAILPQASHALGQGEVIALAISSEAGPLFQQHLQRLQADHDAPVVPVYTGTQADAPPGDGPCRVVFGQPMHQPLTVPMLRQQIEAIGQPSKNGSPHQPRASDGSQPSTARAPSPTDRPR